MTDTNTQTTAPTNDINAPVLDAPGVEWPDDGKLPEQMGGPRTRILPGVHLMRLPSDLASHWAPIEGGVEDRRQFLATGAPNPNFGKKFAAELLKFDATSPLMIEGGAQNGLPFRANFSTAPRPRGKKDDHKTAWISDAQYLLTVSLADTTRPASIAELKAAINRHAGKLVRLETGIGGFCNPTKVRKIEITTMSATGQPEISVIEDPSGVKGCNKRFYTSAFKNPQAANKTGYDDDVLCTCGMAKPEEKAAGKQDVNVVVPGYDQHEKFWPPV